MPQITLKEIAGRLRIDKMKLDDELETQAQIQYEISEALALANQRHSKLESEMEEHDAKLLLSMRKGDVKRTVADLQAEIVTSEEHQSGLDNVQLAQRDASMWHGMYEAWKQRGFALKALADLSTSNYFAVDTTYKRDREKIAESRQSGKNVVRHRRT